MLSFIPPPRCFTPSVLAGPVVTVQVALSDACPVFNRLECDVRYSAEQAQGAATWLPLAAQPPRLFQATLPPPTAEAQQGVRLRIRGQWGHQPDFTIAAPQPTPAPATPAAQVPVEPTRPAAEDTPYAATVAEDRCAIGTETAPFPATVAGEAPRPPETEVARALPYCPRKCWMPSPAARVR
jgi:hypothetical protein